MFAFIHTASPPTLGLIKGTKEPIHQLVIINKKMINEYLRHTVATIDYRFRKSVGNVDDNFGNFNLGKGSRSPIEIINHMYHVLYSTRIFVEEERLNKEKTRKLDLTQEIERFNLELKEIDKTFSVRELGVQYSKKLLQGPLSDILTHIGQISMLQRLNDAPIKWEDFSSAQIQTDSLND